MSSLLFTRKITQKTKWSPLDLLRLLLSVSVSLRAQNQLIPHGSPVYVTEVSPLFAGIGSSTSKFSAG